jgi:YD repeat-containing protein
MTAKISSQLDSKNTQGRFGLMKKTNWLGTLALIGTLLLFVGATMSSAEISDKILPNIIQKLKQQGKKIKSSSVIEIADGEALVVVKLFTGETRKYDGDGKLKETIKPDGTIVIYENGMPVTEKNPAGEIVSQTKYLKNAEGKLRKTVKTGKKGTETKLYDNKGNIVQSTTPQGVKFYSNYLKNEKGKTVSYVEREMNTGKTNRVMMDPKSGAIIAKIDQNGVRTDITTIKDDNGETLASIEETSQGDRTEKRYKNGQMVEQIKNGIRTVHENIMNDKGVLVMKKERRILPSRGGVIEDLTIKVFDESGRVMRKTDKEGEHTYQYVLDKDGRILSRSEDIRSPDGAFEPKHKVTHYDKSGRITGIEEEGKSINTSYVVDEKGNIISSIETMTTTIGSQTFTSTTKKEYNGEGQVTAKTDNFGLRTEFTYDSKGNKTSSRNEFENSQYEYDQSGNLLLTITTDHRSTLYTWHDPKTKLPVKKVKVLNNGVVETTAYGVDNIGRRVSYCQEAFGVRTTIMRDGQSEQPLQTIFTKHNGKQTVTDYVYVGDSMVYSQEVSADSVSETHYNGFGKPTENIAMDKWGRVTVSAHGYVNGRMASTLAVDAKGYSNTEYNKFEQPDTVERTNTIGYPRSSLETRVYKDGILTQSTSMDVKGKSLTTYDQNEQPEIVHRMNLHGFPRQNWVTSIYNGSGELIESFQIDSRGFTENSFDKDGLMDLSIRKDTYGFPKLKTTTYKYEGGELMESRVDDERGFTINNFDVDGLMDVSARTKYYGYPREEASTYKYNGDAYMVWSDTTDENGYTQNWYNIDELVAVSFRENKYGHARQQWTINEYDTEGFMTLSKQTDLKGCSINVYNKDSLATANMRYDDYGVIFGRETITFNNYDSKGFMTTASSKNIMTDMEKTFDKDSLCIFQNQEDHFGIYNSRQKVTADYVYDDHGRMQTSISKDLMGTTYSQFDIHGDAVWTRRFANMGAELGRISTTESAYEADTGMTLWSFSKTALNESLTIHGDDNYALPVKSYSKNYRGAEMGRQTETTMKANIYHGLTEMTFAKNDLSETTTWHTQDTFGLPEKSFTRNYFGAEWSRDTMSWIDTNRFDGMTDKTLSKNKLNYSITVHHQDSWRLPAMSYTHSYYGAEFGRDTITVIQANKKDGMTDQTFAMNKLNWTKTTHADDEWRLPMHSESWGFRGALLGRHTNTDIETDKLDGMTNRTFSQNGLNESTTWHAEDEWRLPMKSFATNYFGANMSRETTTDIETNRLDGMTDKTVAVNDLSTTTTYNAQNQWRLAWLSKTENNFGAIFGRKSLTLLDSDHEDGMTNASFAMNKLSWTLTEYSQDEWRMPQASKSWTFRGALLARVSESQITTNHVDGMTDMTISENGLSRTTTFNRQDEWRLPGLSKTENFRGAEMGRLTWTIIDCNTEDGMNDETLALNELNWNRTVYAEDEYRLPEWSESYNFRGAELGRYTTSDITANIFDGMTDETFARNKLSHTQTFYSSDQWRMANQSQNWTFRGALMSRHTTTEITNSHMDGMTNKTVAQNDLTKTTTWHKQDSNHRLPWLTKTEGSKGAEYGRLTITFITANIMDGMTDETFAMNKLSFTKTIHAQDEWRLPQESLSWGFRGALLGRFTHTDITANHEDGMTDVSFARNSLSWTKTTHSKDEWRMPESSEAWSFRGALMGRHTFTDMECSHQDGMTNVSVSTSELNTTTTIHAQDEWRLPWISMAQNYFGAELGRDTTTFITSNKLDGMTDETFAMNGLNHVKTKHSSDQWRMPYESETLGFRGALMGRYTFTQIQANHNDGMTDKTVAENLLSRTTTFHSQDEWRSPEFSKTENFFGAELGRLTITAMFTDHQDGMTNQTIALNGLNLVITNHASDEWRLPMDSHSFTWRGALKGRYTYTTMDSNHQDGMTNETFAVNGLSETRTVYSQDEWRMPAKSYTHNYYGAEMARDTETDLTSNHMDGMTDLTVAVNPLSTTTTYHSSNEWRLPYGSKTVNNFGANFGRETLTLMESNKMDGMTDETLAWNDLNVTKTVYSQDQWRMAKTSETWSWRGALLGWYTKTEMTNNHMDGMTDMTVAVNDLAKTTTWNKSDEWRLAGLSKSENNFGAELGRLTWTTINTNTEDGMTDDTWATNGLSLTHSMHSSDEFRLPEASESWNFRGALLARYTHTDIWSNEDDGMSDFTLAKSALSYTLTVYSQDMWRMPEESHTWNFQGALGGRYTHTEIESNHIDGMTDKSVAENDLNRTTTLHASNEWRLPIGSFTESFRGAELGRETITLIDANKQDGMTDQTLGMSALNWTWTVHGTDEYRLPEESLTKSFRGAYMGRMTYTDITASINDGATDETTGVNGLSSTKTVHSQDEWRMAEHSQSTSFRGALLSRVTETDIFSNHFDGMTDFTIAENGINTVISIHAQDEWRLPKQSLTFNKFGANFGRFTNTAIVSDKMDGMTNATLGSNKLSMTLTVHSTDEFRLPDYSMSLSFRGALDSRFTFTDITANKNDGMTDMSEAETGLGTTTTWHGSDEWRAPEYSYTQNKKGAKFGRNTLTAIETSHLDGMTDQSFASNGLNNVLTIHSQDEYRLALESYTNSFRGALGSRFTHTLMTSNQDDGMSNQTHAFNALNNVRTVYSQDQWRQPEKSYSENYRGAEMGRETETDIFCNRHDGMTDVTVSQNDLNTSLTVHGDDEFRLPVSSLTLSYRGALKGRLTASIINCNEDDGMTDSSLVLSGLSLTLTTHSTDQWRMPATTQAYNFRGALEGRSSMTVMTTNKFDGMNEKTVATTGLNKTTTYHAMDEWRLPMASVTENFKGALDGRDTSTQIIANQQDGMTDETWAFNGLSAVHTVHSTDEYRLPDESETWNYKGAELGRYTYTDMQSSIYDGMTNKSIAENALSISTTWHTTDDMMRLPYLSKTENNRGARFGRVTWTDLHADDDDGMTDWTFAENQLNKTWTFHHTDDDLRLPDWSMTYNKRGATSTRWTTTQITADPNDGMTNKTVATSDVSVVTTKHSSDEWRLAYESVSNNVYGPGGGKVTTTELHNDHVDGMTNYSIATNDLSYTRTNYSQDQWRMPKSTYTYNYRGAAFGRASYGLTQVDRDTGLNEVAYSISQLSESWTYYDGDGLQTHGWSKMHPAITLPYARLTYNEYTMRSTIGTMQYSKATNQLGITHSYYDTDGLMSSSYNYAAYGSVSLTYTTYDTDSWTGMNKTSDATSYSRKPGWTGVWVSKAHSYYDGNGLNYRTDTTKRTGPKYGRSSTTYTTNDQNTGTKKSSSTTSGMNDMSTLADNYGIDTWTRTNNYYGVHHSRQATEWSHYNSNNGIKTRSYSESTSSKTYSWFDANGMPRGGSNMYQLRKNTYSSSEGGRVEKVYAGNVHFDGATAMTRSVTKISSTDSWTSWDGFATKSETGNQYGGAGEEFSRTYPTVNKNTGMNISTWKYNYHDGSPWGRSYSTFNQTYGIATYTKNWSCDNDGKEQDPQITTTNFNTTTGMTTSTYTYGTGDGDYKSWGTSYDANKGWKLAGETHQDKADGKDTVREKFRSSYQYNPYTGLMKKEVRTNISHSDNETIWYDAHGVENSSASSSSWRPSGSAFSFTQYSGKTTPNGNPTEAVNNYSGDGFGETMTLYQHDMVMSNAGQSNQEYHPRWEEVQLHYGQFVTSMTIHYILSADGPTSATVSDDKGTEQWTMTGQGYGNANIITRSRTNTDGSTITWNYTDLPAGGPYHRNANITYTGYMGVYSGSGSESYSASGIVQNTALNNTNGWNETINYQNDGQYVTTSIGTREDGVSVNYSHTGLGEIAVSSDDKGVTTWDPAENRMLSTAGGLGNFTYTYNGGFVEQITGDVTAGGSVVMDQNWNVGSWTDTQGVVHNYTPASATKDHWTSASEAYTDANGTAWSGTVQYQDNGFYFEEATLQATNADLNASSADNSVAMDNSAAYAFIQQLIGQYQTENETFSWKPAGDTRNNMTLGACKLLNFDATDVTGFADVIVNINGDGTSESIFNNMNYFEDQFTKTDRFKPTKTSRTYTVIQPSAPSTGDRRDMNKYNNVFYNGAVGLKDWVQSSRQVQTGTTTETYYLEIIADDPDTEENEYQEIEHTSQAYDGEGNPLYQQRTRENPVYGTEWTIAEENWTKTADGWQWVATGVSLENSYTDAMTLDTGTLTAGPIGQTGDTSHAATNMRTYRTSSGNQSGGVSLVGGSADGFSYGAGSLPDGEAGEFGDLEAPDEMPDAPTGASVDAGMETELVGKGGAPAAEEQTEDQVEDELAAAFADIQSVDDVVAFLQLVVSKMSVQSIVSALKNSTIANLMNGLTAAYKAVFGDAYQNSLLGKLTIVATNTTTLVEDLKVAIAGGAVVANEVKLAAKIARDMENAQSVKKDEKGNVIEVVDANGSTHKYQYEAKGFTETIKDGSQTETNYYNEEGQLLSQNLGDMSRTYSYVEEGGHVAKVTMVERNANGSTTLEYDGQGRLTSEEQGNQKTVYEYDGMSTDTYTAQVFGANGTKIEDRSYKNGRLASKRGVDGSSAEYSYMTDGAGEVLAVTAELKDKNGDKTYLKYDGAGRLISAQGKEADKYEQMAKQDDSMAEQAFVFGAEKDLFGDKRMDNKRLAPAILDGLFGE